MYPFAFVLISGILVRHGQKSVSVVCYNNIHRNYTKLMMSTAKSDKMESCSLIKDLNKWEFAPSKLLQFPLDPVEQNFVRRIVRNAVFSRVNPTPLTNPKLVAYSEDALTKILNMDVAIAQSEEFVQFIAGNKILKSSAPLAHRYGGHQFGYWAMQLGDGRAILLGEFVNSQGERWELQLKGAGRTPYSREGDGRAVLRSSIREFLASEAMYYLGVPTSRAGAIIVSDDHVVRDPMYSGQPIYEKTAVVLRIAKSWFRFGSFEILCKSDEIGILKDLVDFIIKEHYPEIDPKDEDRVVQFFHSVTRLTLDLVVWWQAVGFTHGVLNTDNMSVLGITIDYGPFGFMDTFDPKYVPNASDHEARYCYGQQVEIVVWNLFSLWIALKPLLTESQVKESHEVLQAEVKNIASQLQKMYSEKLGLKTSHPDLPVMIQSMMLDSKADYTMTFRQLSETSLKDLENPKSCLWAIHKLSKLNDYPKFYNAYVEQLKKDGVSDEERMKKMCEKNPRYVLRNWMAQEAIKVADDNDFTEVNRLLRVLKHPYTKQDEAEERGYASPPPDWARELRLSCSS